MMKLDNWRLKTKAVEVFLNLKKEEA